MRPRARSPLRRDETWREDAETSSGSYREYAAPTELRARIADAARYVPLDRLAISPQCGFASVASGNAVSAEVQERKLRLVAAVARAVWQ